MVWNGTSPGQTLSSPRAIGLAAYAGVVSDSRGFAANPAGLAGLIDWEFNAAAYLPTTEGGNGAVFHGLTIGKKLFGRHAFALQFSEGTLLEFVFPGEAVVIGPDPTSVDRRVSYAERLTLAYALSPIPELSVGTEVRFRQEKVTDTQYQLADTVIQRLPDAVYQDDSWNIDLGLMVKPQTSWTISVLGRNILRSRADEFPAEFSGYHIDRDAALELGASYHPVPSLTVAAQGSTRRMGAAGVEWSIGRSLDLRGGVYMNEEETQFLYALGTGLGWTYEFIDVDLSYLHFFDRATHGGTVQADRFDPSSISMIDLNPYTVPRLSVAVNARFGNIEESPIQIDGVRVLGPVYPTSSERLAYTPIATAFVTNISERPVQIQAAFFIDKVMDAPTESQPVFISPGQQAEIPLTALFNREIMNITTTEMREATVSVSGGSRTRPPARSTVRVLLHGRNAWDGDGSSLRYFVTPEDSSVLRYTRELLYSRRSASANIPSHIRQFHNAKTIIEAFAGNLVYVTDPRSSADVVQYPAETLNLRGGDCDDMTVCFSSLLGSIGIATAFVDVVPPGAPDKGHVYLLFDSGVPPPAMAELSDNPRRFVIRPNNRNEETLWIPIETTAIMKGFEEAWRIGAEEYLEEVEINLGVAKGWVNIIDVR